MKGSVIFNSFEAESSEVIFQATLRVCTFASEEEENRMMLIPGYHLVSTAFEEKGANLTSILRTNKGCLKQPHLLLQVLPDHFKSNVHMFVR